MVLDDALANFDDARCAAALDYLTREAQNRQILLFTCHSREADFLENRPEVAVWRLTEALLRYKIPCAYKNIPAQAEKGDQTI